MSEVVESYREGKQPERYRGIGTSQSSTPPPVFTFQSKIEAEDHLVADGYHDCCSTAGTQPSTKPSNIDETPSTFTLTSHTSLRPSQEPQPNNPMRPLHTWSTPTSSQTGGHVLHGAHSVTISGGIFYTVGGNMNFGKVQTLFQDVKKLANWLTKINYREVWMDYIAQRTPGTGAWYLRRRQFTRWMENPGEILCGTGIPGAGKTIISSIVIQHLQEYVDVSTGTACVAFAFYRYSDQVSVKDILAALVRQLLEDHPAVYELVKVMYDHHNRRSTHPSKAELLNILQQTSRIFTRRFYTLDALDEMPNDVQVEILQALASLNANLFFASRPLTLPQVIGHRAAAVEISAQEEDIKILIERAIDQSSDFRHLLRHPSNQTGNWEEKVALAVREKSGGIFLLVTLQIDMLQQCLNIAELEEALLTMPEGIKEMYGTTIQRIRNQPKNSFNLAQRVFLWLRYAQRSLTIPELKYAIAIDPKTYQFEANRVVHEDRLVSVCCGLVTVDQKSGHVRLIHHTAVDSLREALPHIGESPHSFISIACVRFLWEHLQPYNTSDPAKRIRQASVNPSTKAPNHPFYDYAFAYWAAHAHQLEHVPTRVIEFISNCERFPLRVDRRTRTDDLQPLHVAAWAEFADYLASLRSKPQTDFNLRTKLGETALTLAATVGNAGVVRLLLGVPGIDVNLAGEEKWTGLMSAAAGGYTEVVRLLLGVEDIDVNAKDELDRTALIWASILGHEDVVEELLQMGERVEANVRDAIGQTALLKASMEGHEGVVRLLMGFDGVDVNVQDGLGETALMKASSIRRAGAAITRALLQSATLDVNVKEKEGNTALINACTHGYEEVVQALMECSRVDVNTQNAKGDTALIAAASAGQGEVVKLLLKSSKTDVNAKGFKQTSALISASAEGQESVVKTLLGVDGIELNARDEMGRTALISAAHKNRLGVVQTLLNFEGVDANVQDKLGSTARNVAWYFGYHAVVEMLEVSGGKDGDVELQHAFLQQKQEEDEMTEEDREAEKEEEEIRESLLIAAGRFTKRRFESVDSVQDSPLHKSQRMI